MPQRKSEDDDPQTALFSGPGTMRACCRTLDWTRTPLGSVANWSESLRTSAGTVLGSAFPMVLLWGPELVQIYNDGYVPFLAARHPAALGQPARACWPEVWHINAPIYERVAAGQTVALDEAHLPVRRYGPDGPVEQAYVTLSYSPVPDGTGRIGGILVTLVDTTELVQGRAEQSEREEIDARLHGALLEAALVLNQVRDAYLLMDAELRVVTMNKSAERLLARPRAELVGRTHWDVFPASLGAELEHQYRRVAAERVEAHFTHHYVAENYDAHLEIDAYPASGGGVAVFCRDVSERLALQAAAEAARSDAETRAATLAAVIESIPDALLVTRRDAVVLANPVALEELGVASTAVLRDTASDGAFSLEALLLDPETGEPLPLDATPIGLALGGARSHGHFLLRALNGRGEPRPVRAAAAPIIASDGQVTGVVTVLTDMTAVQHAAAERERLLAESEQARAEAEAARIEAEAANRSKSEFLAVMSHELRTPLNAIGGYAELIEMGIRGPVTDAQRSDLARIQKSQRHLLGLINGVLNYAKVDAGAVYYDVTDVALDEVLATCEALIAPQASAKRIALTFAGCDPSLRVRADREKVQQVVLNLLSNAVKFTDPDGQVSLACSPAVRAAGEGPGIVVEVRDTGQGIAPDQVERIFQPFVQVDARLTRTQEGTGLGLAISRDLARGMGGDLTVESILGQGSTFTLTLPTA
jgi:PAS domain S-box-containing protein